MLQGLFYEATSLCLYASYVLHLRLTVEITLIRNKIAPNERKIYIFIMVNTISIESGYGQRYVSKIVPYF